MRNFLIISLIFILMNCISVRYSNKLNLKNNDIKKISCEKILDKVLDGYGIIQNIDKIKINRKKIYLISTYFNKIIVLNFSGIYLKHYDGYKLPGNKFINPASISFDKSGTLYLIEKNTGKIKRLLSTGEVYYLFGEIGHENSNIFEPEDIVIDDYGNILICDTGNNFVKKFDINGNLIFYTGGFGYGKGFFNNPFKIEIDKYENFYIFDKGNNRIQKFDFNGKFIGEINGYANYKITSFCINGEFIYISFNNFIEIYSLDGKLVDRKIIKDVKKIKDIEAGKKYIFILTNDDKLLKIDTNKI